MLGPKTGEQERDRRIADDRCRWRGQSGERRREPLAVARHARGAVLEVRSPGRGAEAEITGPIGAVRDARRHRGGELAERGGCAGRDRQHVDRPIGAGRRRLCHGGGRRCLFQNDVCVRPAETERAHAADTWA